MKKIKLLSTFLIASIASLALLLSISQAQSTQTVKQSPQINATSIDMPATLQKTTDGLLVANESVLSEKKGHVMAKDGTITEFQKNITESMLLVTTKKLKNVNEGNLILATPENMILITKKAALSGNSKANLTWNSMMTERMSPNLALAFDSQTSVDQEIASGMMITNTTKTFENSNMLFGDLVKSMQSKQANSSFFTLIPTNSESMIGYLNSELAISSTLFAAYDTGVALGAIYV